MNTKVQKNSIVTNNENKIDPYSPLELLNNDRIREVILQIISEHVVNFRRHDAIEMYLNTFDPNNKDQWNEHPVDGNSGLDKVFVLLGITPRQHFDFYDSLDKMAWDIIDGSKNKADLVALTILSRWVPEITNYFNSKN